jgi:DNA repair exonuclease SbcCD ATPase subunit
MLSSDETGYDTSGSIMRASRAASRRELIQNKRARQTDRLPGVDELSTRGRIPRSPGAQLREENIQLRRELTALQEQLELYQSNMDLLDGEIETIHHAHQQEIEQYQQHLREMMEERNSMHEINQQWERRYQELYRSFQDAVDEEANKLVQEAAQTLVLSPEHTPALLSDVVKTLESQVKQTEDQRTAELLAVMRQAQYKSELLEQEVAQERSSLAAERENLRLLRESAIQQAQQRYTIERTRLRGRWTAGLTFISMVLFALMVGLELIFYSLHVALAITLFVPLAICMLLSYVFAHLHTSGRVHVQIKAQPQKSAARGGKAAPPAAKTAAK